MVAYVWHVPDSRYMENATSCTDISSYARLLAIRLRSLRVERGLTQEQVAYRSGISTYTYQKFEKGESKPGTPMIPRLSTLLSLAETFEVDIRELLSFK